MSEQDKRKDPRVQTRQGIWMEGQDAKALNMSKSGMFVVAPAGAGALGTTLEIKFEDPKEGQISLQMEVVWRDESKGNSSLGLRAIDSIGRAAFERVVTRYLDGDGNEITPDAENPTGERKQGEPGETK